MMPIQNAMDDLVDLRVEEEAWQALELEDLAKTAFKTTLDHLEIQPKGYEISLLACNDAMIAELNAEFREKPKPTNVLSWPAHYLAPENAGGQPLLPPDPRPEAPELGDIAISYQTCAAEAEAAGRKISDHVTHLLVHGCLHLLGYDHETDEDATVMETLEVAILERLDIRDPYRVGA